MIRKYEKQDAPAWQRRLVVFVSGLFAATLLLLAVCVTASGTFDGLFERTEVSGLDWQRDAQGAPAP